MSRADLLELLEVERYVPPPPVPRPALEPISAEQAARNQAILAAALGTDRHAVAWAERVTS